MIRTTIIGGILFLVPVVILFLILGKAFELSLMIAGPVNELIPIERLRGVVFANISAIAIILLICYLAGLLARREVVRSKVSALDGALIEMIPAYAFVKTMVSSFAHAEDESGTLTPVAVAFDDSEQIAFEVERDDERVVVYLPGAPSPWSGSICIVEVHRVRPLDLNSHQTAKIVQLLGRGSLKALAAPAPLLRSESEAMHSARTIDQARAP